MRKIQNAVNVYQNQQKEEKKWSVVRNATKANFILKKMSTKAVLGDHMQADN